MSTPDLLQSLLPKAEPSAPPAAFEALPRGDLLLSYQQQSLGLFDTTALLLIEKSRRIGLTWGIASYAALEAAKAKSDGGMNVYYMGYDLEMAREFIDVVGMWAKVFSLVASPGYEEVLPDPDDPDKHIKTFRVDFASGFSVVALPSVARALRGKQGIVLLDEAAFHSDLAEVLKAAMALMIWGGRVAVISTHNGIDNPFNQLLDDVRAGRRKGKTLRITFNDAIDAGLYERIRLVHPKPDSLPAKEDWIAEVRGFYGDDAEEELDCVPKAGAGSWLNAADITACEHEEAGKPERYTQGPAYIGWDVARRRDFTVRWVFENVGGILWLRHRQEQVGQRFQDQYDAFGGLMKNYRVFRANIDQTGMGEPVVEAMQDLHGSERVRGTLLTGPNRLALATLLKKRFEDGTIRIPPDPAIRADLRALKKKGGVAGGPPRLVEDGEVHPDLFWAAALACAAAEEGEFMIDFHSVGMRESGAFTETHKITDRGFGTVSGGADFNGY